jgi:superfamily II DNA or RNA helicase
VLQVALEQRRKDGDWGLPRAISLGAGSWASVASGEDDEIAQMLTGTGPVYGGASVAAGAGARFTLNDRAQPILLPRLCATGRCRALLVAGERHGMPLAWDDGPPWELTIALVDGEQAGHLRLVPVFRRGGERLSDSPPPVALRGGVIIAPRDPFGPLSDIPLVAARLDDHGAFALLATLHENPALELPAADVAALIAELCALPQLPPLEIPPALGISESHARPTPVLTLTPITAARGASEELDGAIRFEYEGVAPPASEVAAATFDAVTGRIVRRDREAERLALEHLANLGFRDEIDYRTGDRIRRLPPNRLGAVLRQLPSEGWRVDLSGRALHAAGDARIEISSGIDWFDLHASVDFGPARAELPRLLAALRRGEEFVALSDGSLGLIPLEWARRLASLAALGKAPGEDGDAVRFSRTQAGILDVLLAESSDVTIDEAYAHARDALRSFDRIEPLEAPEGFVGTLRPYQREGLGWLEFLRRFGLGGCLADDMGLGKTVQVLAMLEARRRDGAGPSLVVVPRSLVFNWRREAERFTPALRVLDHSGVRRARATDHFADHDLVLTTYGTLRRDAMLFRDLVFEYVILDEANAIKNASTQAAKAARLLRARHRLALTGTPVENRLEELWSLLEFLNPGMLGNASVFRSVARASDAEARSLIAQAVRPVILRRTKEQVAPDLPRKQEQTVYVELSREERSLYDELRDHYRAALRERVDRVGVANARIQILEALLRLRQAACHPGLLDEARRDETSSKLEVLVPQLAEVVEGGHKALVFSQFTSFLALLRSRLDAEGIVYEYLDGRTRDRAERVARFQEDPACPIFLVSLKAGGVGLNLTAADYVFLLDPWWNPAAESQAIDRAHRIGQTRHVLASRLIARDTVEERVLELQATKRALADAIIGEDNAVLSRMGREELEMLLA